MAVLTRAEAYEKYSDELVRFATGLVGPTDGPDVLAAAMVNVLSMKSWDSVENPRAYLYRTVLNEAKRSRRRTIRRRAGEINAREFVSASPRWSGADARSPTEGMTAVEAVEARYAALNSYDPAALEAVLGSPPAEGLLWLWKLGNLWTADCEPVAGDPTLVRCEETWDDDFYTKAGAQFVYGKLWIVADGRLSALNEWEMTSGYWAYVDFEIDFGRWMLSAYPDDHQLAFAGARLARTPEAAAIAVARIDEFLDQSAEYPRSPDPINELGN